MDRSSELIKKAIAEAKSGNKAGAKKILAQVVMREPGNAQAWYLLSRLLEEKEQIIYCLHQVLKIMPDSTQAKARLKKLQSTAKPPIPTQNRRRNRLGMMILIGSAGVVGLFLISIALYLGINALGFFITPTATKFFLQASNPKISGVNPVLVLTDTPESKPTDTILAFATNTTTFTDIFIPSLTPADSTIPNIIGAPSCIPPNAQIQLGDVLRVIDGDTIDVLVNDQTYRVRYIGIDTPETNDPETGLEPFGPEAAAKNNELVDGEEIVLVKDVSETDQYGRLLRYAFVGGVFVNYELVASGYATALPYPPDVACEETFSSAEGNARSQELGLWAPVPIPTPTESRILEGGENCDPAYPDVCIPSSPPDLDCGDIPHKRFRVLPPDPHRFDRDQDGIGCES
jgi:micrococcal nuclease